MTGPVWHVRASTSTSTQYAVLAQILGEAARELEELTQHFAPRGADETPAQFAKRMVGSAAAVYACTTIR